MFKLFGGNNSVLTSESSRMQNIDSGSDTLVPLIGGNNTDFTSDSSRMQNIDSGSDTLVPLLGGDNNSSGFKSKFRDFKARNNPIKSSTKEELVIDKTKLGTFKRIGYILLMIGMYCLIFYMIGTAPKKYGFKYDSEALALIIISAITQLVGFCLVGYYGFDKGLNLYYGVGLLLLIVTIVMHSIMLHKSLTGNNEEYSHPNVDVGLSLSSAFTFGIILATFNI